MSFFSVCPKCGAKTIDYNCLTCLIHEFEALQSEHEKAIALIENIREDVHCSDDATSFMLWLMEKLPKR